MIIDQWVVELLTAAIVSSLLAICWYLWRWNIADAVWKSTVCSRLGYIEKEVHHTATQLESVQLPVAIQRLDMLEIRVDRLEAAQ